jgi:2-polyprenyl-6-methoxyphenol hydroxylase-like FAD-dependent oxidoreductase
MWLTRYRGEGVNHGILDAFWLSKTINAIVKGEEKDASAAVCRY